MPRQIVVTRGLDGYAASSAPIIATKRAWARAMAVERVFFGVSIHSVIRVRTWPKPKSNRMI